MRGICTILRKITTTMTQELQFIPFESRSDKGWAEAWDLYEESFPRCERWNAQGYDRAFGDPRFEADGIWRGEEFIGILFHWNAGAYRYVEHLAVSPALRGQNMGSKALTAFCRWTTSRSAAVTSTNGWASSPTPTSTSTLHSANPSRPIS